MTSLLMIFRRRPVRKALVAFLGGMAVILLGTLAPPVRKVVKRFDRLVGDEIIRAHPGPGERDDIVLLGIDDVSLGGTDLDPDLVANDPILSKMTGRFPWDRSVWAATIDRLGNAGAKLIVIDLILSEETYPQYDADLAEAIGRHRDKVVLASAFSESGSKDTDELNYTLMEPLADFFGPGPDDTRCGYSNFWPDDDNTVRSALYQTTIGELNGRRHPDEVPTYSLAGEILRAMGKPVPEGPKELRLTFNSKGLADTAEEVYAPRSLRTLFVPEDWKRNYAEGGFFKDKIVFIGPTAPRFQDKHRTLGGVITGPQLHLQALTCGLEGAYVTRFGSNPMWGLWTGLVALAVAVTWCLLVRRPVVSALGALGIVAGSAIAIVWLGSISLIVPLVLAFLTFVGGWILAQTFDLVTERLERGRLHREFRRFVSRDVADTLVRDPDMYRRVAGGLRRHVVVLFSDVRGFTSRSEDTDPVEIVAQLNEYLTRMVTVVFDHGGTLDKFIGDAVMAHWGALGDGDAESNGRQAVIAAREMLVELDELNAKWENEGRVPFKIGIGVHMGEVLAGEIGSAQRTEFGVIGDAVNLASRIEGMTKYFGVPLLVSGSVMEAAGDRVGLRCVGRIRVKGRHEPVELHAPSRGKARDAAFAAALELFQKGDFAAATEALRAIIHEDPDDGAAGRLAKWSGDYEVEPPSDWDGTVVMDSK